MSYIEVLTRINTMSTVYDVEQIVAAISGLQNAEEYESAKDALFRAVLTKAKAEHPKTSAMATYALTLRA
jgi:hypothetical protein